MLHPPLTLAVRGGFLCPRRRGSIFSLSLLTQNCIMRIIQLETALFE